MCDWEARPTPPTTSTRWGPGPSPSAWSAATVPAMSCSASSRARGCETDGIVAEAGRDTPVKTRIMAGGYRATRQQIVRLDREPAGEIGPVTGAALLERLSALAGGAHAIIVSDYGYGTVTPRVFELRPRPRAALGQRGHRGQPVRSAPLHRGQRGDAERGRAAATQRRSVDDERSVEKAGRQLLERLDAGMLLVTRGSQGMALLERDGATSFIAIHGTDEIADVTGAGDTVISAFTVALASGVAPVDAAHLANVAGGLVVMKRGTATVSRADLARSVDERAPS